jgi:hypothetical protein
VNVNDIRERSTAGSFPIAALEKADTACLLFCAGFHGSNDAIFVHDAGINHAVLVDNDFTKLSEMQGAWANYQDDWEFKLDDAYDFVQVAGRRYDVIVADPWTGHINRAMTMLAVWHRYAARALIIGVTKVFLGEHEQPPTLAGFNIWLHSAFPSLPEATDLHQRSDYRGGVYWAVIPGKDLPPDAS